MTMKRIIISAVAMAAFSASAKALTLSLPEDIRYSVKLGYNIGGTAPLGIPATIRKMNRYKMQSNYSLAFDIQKQIKGRWGAMTGIKLENKGMEVDATVKNYHMSMVKGSSRLTGYYTGNTVIKAEEWALTLPIQATYTPAKNVLVRLGPYVSYVTSRKFDGYVYSGYLRENTPTGAKILMGDSESEGATFDFSDDMRHWQFGIDAGVDWYVYKRWGIYADLSWGFTNIFKKGFDTIEQKLYPIYGTVGVTYNLK